MRKKLNPAKTSVDFQQVIGPHSRTGHYVVIINSVELNILIGGRKMSAPPESILYLLVPGIPVILTSMLCYDRVVRWQHQHHHDMWRRDGSPDGYFWTPDDAIYWKSNGAKISLSFRWLFETPSWIAEMKNEKRFFTLFRSCNYLWFAGFAAFLTFRFFI